MVIKYIVLSLIVIVCAFLGFQLSETVKLRVTHLAHMLNAIVYLQNEIFYSLTPLPEALMRVSSKKEKPISKFLEDISNLLYSNDINNINTAFTKAIEKNKDELMLEKEDYGILLELSNSLGSTDLNGQKKIFQIAIGNLENNLKEATEKAKKNVKMYRVLGVSMGLVIAIFLI